MAANKSPFEIRSEMLAMAKDYMDQQWHLNVDFTKQMLEQGQKSMEDVQEALKPYSMDELVEKAKEMYAFVTKKD